MFHNIFTSMSTTDCYPFGQEMPNRNFSSGAYRFGFNGKEKDDEMKGSGNSLDFGARIYDSRVGRWWSTDSKMEKYPSLSPYQFCANNPVLFVDPSGNEIWIQGAPGTYPILYVPNKTVLIEGVDEYVRTVAATLDKMTNSGFDKLDIVSKLANDCSQVKIKSAPWNEHLGCNPLRGKDGNVSTDIPWSPESGSEVEPGVRHSPALGLLHELGEVFYEQYDPTGEVADRPENQEGYSEINPADFAASIIYHSKIEKACGVYESPSDRYIIQNIEPGTGEPVRTSHDKYVNEFKATNPFSLEGPSDKKNDSDKTPIK
jgi:RHS repeat-associated protein